MSQNVLKEFDQEHEKLAELINDLYESKKTNEEKKIVGKMIDALLDYADKHFKREEALMQKIGYPEYKQHKTQHEVIVQKVLDLKKVYSSGVTDAAFSISLLLNEWLMGHLHDEDKKIADYLSRAGPKRGYGATNSSQKK